MTEKKKGLWANIHAKRKRGERPARPGEKGYPKTLDIEEAKKDTDMYTYIDQSKGQVIKGKSGTFVGYTHSATKGKGANILKHNQTKKYYAAGGSSTAFTQKTTLHDTPEDAARAYHKGNLAEASPMIKPPKNEFSKKEDAFAHAKQHGGKVFKKTFTHPTSGMKNVSYVVKEETELDEAIKLNSKVKIHAPGKDYHGKVGRVGEIRKGLHDKAPKTYTVDYDYDTKTGNKKSIQLDKSRLKMHNEEAEIDEASKKPNATTRHLRDYPVSDKDVAKPVKKPEKKNPEQGVAEDEASRKTAPGWHSDSVKNPNFNDELSIRRVSPPGKRLKSGKLSADERGSQERTKALMKFKREKGGLTGPKSPLPEDRGVAEETKKMKGKDPCWTGYKMIGTKEKDGKQVPNCVPVKEQMTFRKLREQDSKEVQEYDYEGDMARSDLRSIIMNAKEVHDMLESNTNLPEWVQSKITLSEDYISTVRNYMRSENDNV